MSVLEELGLTAEELRESLAGVPLRRPSGGRGGERIDGEAILHEGLYLDEQVYEDDAAGRRASLANARRFRAEANGKTENAARTVYLLARSATSSRRSRLVATATGTRSSSGPRRAGRTARRTSGGGSSPGLSRP